MIKKDYVFPYDICDGVGKCVRWEGDKLSMTFFSCYECEGMPNKIDVIFHGVEWIRSTSLRKYPCPDEEWDDWGYESDKPIDYYLLVEREWLNNDYEKFMFSGVGLTVRCLEDNLVFIDDLLIFPCTNIEIVNAVCIKDIMSVEKKCERQFNKKYKRRQKEIC